MSPSHPPLLTSRIHIQSCLTGRFLVGCPRTHSTWIKLNSFSFPNHFFLLHPSERLPLVTRVSLALLFSLLLLPLVTETYGFHPHISEAHPLLAMPVVASAGHVTLRSPLTVAACGWPLPPCLSSRESFVFAHDYHSHLRKCLRARVTFLLTNSPRAAPTDIGVHFKLPDLAYMVLPDLTQIYL